MLTLDPLERFRSDPWRRLAFDIVVFVAIGVATSLALDVEWLAPVLILASARTLLTLAQVWRARARSTS